MSSRVDIHDKEVGRALIAAGEATDTEKAELKAIAQTVSDARAQITALEAVEAEALARAATIAAAQCDRTGIVKASQREMPLRSIAAELAAALRVSPRTMQSRLKDAEDLVRRFPETFEAWPATARWTSILRESFSAARPCGSGC